MHLSKIVLKSLSKSPDDRFQTANEFRIPRRSLRATTSILPASKSRRQADRIPRIRTPIQRALDAPIQYSRHVSRDLAYHVGPIAKVVSRAQPNAAISLDELYTLLATEISTEEKPPGLPRHTNQILHLQMTALLVEHLNRLLQAHIHPVERPVTSAISSLPLYASSGWFRSPVLIRSAVAASRLTGTIT